MLAWTPRTDLSPVGDVYTGLETTAGGVGTVGALTTASFSLVVAPVIASRRAIGGISGVEPIDGSVTLEVVYP
jgi:hypothetical protein